MITRIGNGAIRRVLLSSSRVVRPTISFQQTDTFAKPMCMISPKRRSIFPLQQHQQPRSFAFTTASSPLYKQEELDEYLNSLSPARKKFMTILNEYKVSKNMHSINEYKVSKNMHSIYEHYANDDDDYTWSATYMQFDCRLAHKITNILPSFCRIYLQIYSYTFR